MSFKDIWSGIISATAESNLNARPFKDFRTSSSPTADQTVQLQTACAAAVNDGFALRLGDEVINYEAKIPLMNRSIIGVGKGISKIICRTSEGRDSRIDFVGAENAVVQGVTFHVPNKPVDPTNNALETDMILRFQGGKNNWVIDCDFIEPFGVPVNIRHMKGGGVVGCKAIGGWKDGFHTTGTSEGIIIIRCVVINGGDDAFPVVGYTLGTGAGQPYNIYHLFNQVYGVKHARCFAYVGAKKVKAIGCYASGTIPAEFPQLDELGKKYGSKAGIYIASEASFNTFGNEDLDLEIDLDNCGRVHENDGVAHGAIHIVGRSGATTKNIKLKTTIQNSGKEAILAYGNVTGGIQDLNIEARVIDTTDVNGSTVAAGTGTYNGMEFQNVHNLTVNAYIEETGGSGAHVQNTCTGKVRVHVASKNINKSGTSGRDIILVASGSQADEIYTSVDVVAQPQVNTAGTPYYIDRIIECANPGKVRQATVSGAQLDKRVLLASGAANTAGSSEQPLVPIASPTVFENVFPYPVLFRVSGGTVTGIARGLKAGLSVPVYTTLPGRTAGYIRMLPGELVQVTYTAAPTLSWIPEVA